MRALVLAAVAAMAVAGPVTGQGWIDPVRPVPQWSVAKLRTSVNVRVTGRIARVEVEEWFQNRGGGMGESDYLYPLPGEAVFSNFSLFQGDNELRGETMDANRARAIYEEIVRTKRDPALIELAGHGLVRARVFPIANGETRKITLRYTQMLNKAGDALQFRYAAGARTGNIGRVVPVRAPVVQEEQSRGPDRAPLTFTLTIDDGREFRAAFSPTHEVRSERSGERLTVRPRGELDGDFVLFLPLARTTVGLTLATHRPSGEPGYFMLTLSPSEARTAVLPRDITAVIDVSGSMSGEKMQQARNALRQLLGSLTERDRFRLISFSSDVRSYRPDWTRASAAELNEARRWVDNLIAEGGTNISGALTEAFRATTPDDRLGIVLFLTDGLPSIGEQNPERIAQRAETERGQTRVFAFGVGYDVNTYLLDRLSAAARGTTQYVRPGENVEQAVAAFAAKVRQPVLANLRIADGAVNLVDVYPRQLPDLFAGEELVLFGRYTVQRDTEADVTISGQRGGRTERYATQAHFAEHENGNDFIPRLWAARKLGHLSQQMKLHGQNPEIVEEIRALALRYGLLSEFTSYLVQEPVLAFQARGGAVPPASAPMAANAVGQKAVESSMNARLRREASSSMQLAAAEEVAARDARKDDASARIVGGRRFRLEGEVWKDTGYRPNSRIVTIEPFSEAYFSVLRSLPELEKYWKDLGSVLVAGQRVSVQVSKGGLTRLSTAELNRLTAEFRTR